METCTICKKRMALRIRTPDDNINIKCDLCGHVVLSRTDESILSQTQESADIRLLGWIRAQNLSGNVPAQIVDLKTLLKNLPSYKPLQKQLLLLRTIEQQTGYPGQHITLWDDIDRPLAWADNSEEFNYHIRCLKERRLISSDNLGGGRIDTVITADGWEELSKRGSQAFSDQVFVAMSFSTALEDAWKIGIDSAIRLAGYKPLRVDKQPHLDRIDAKIISDIKDSFFMVADVTEQRQGVYFEAGYAIGLGRPVIWCVRDDELKKVHFDTRQYNHVVWQTPDDLRKQLYYTICAVIGKGKEVEKGQIPDLEVIL